MQLKEEKTSIIIRSFIFEGGLPLNNEKKIILNKNKIKEQVNYLQKKLYWTLWYGFQMALNFPSFV